MFRFCARSSVYRRLERRHPSTSRRTYKAVSVNNVDINEIVVEFNRLGLDISKHDFYALLPRRRIAPQLDALATQREPKNLMNHRRSSINSFCAPQRRTPWQPHTKKQSAGRYSFLCVFVPLCEIISDQPVPISSSVFSHEVTKPRRWL